MSTRKLRPQERYFRYLSRLSRGGRSNMYGAIPYLAAAFGLDREAAFRTVCEWVDAQAAVQPPTASSPAIPVAKTSTAKAPAARSPTSVAGARNQPPDATRKPTVVKRKRAGVRRAA